MRSQAKPTLEVPKLHYVRPGAPQR